MKRWRWIRRCRLSRRCWRRLNGGKDCRPPAHEPQDGPYCCCPNHQPVDITSTVPAAGWGSWNSVCWYGSLTGLAAEVMPACERAVALAPEDGGIRDSRGLACALTGDLEGARKDFEFAVPWAEEAGADAAFIESCMHGSRQRRPGRIRSMQRR